MKLFLGGKQLFPRKGMEAIAFPHCKTRWAFVTSIPDLPAVVAAQQAEPPLAHPKYSYP